MPGHRAPEAYGEFGSSWNSGSKKIKKNQKSINDSGYCASSSDYTTESEDEAENSTSKFFYVLF